MRKMPRRVRKKEKSGGRRRGKSITSTVYRRRLLGD